MTQRVAGYLDTPQTSANAYATLAGSVVTVDPDGDNSVRLMVEETGGTNGITARLMGRHVARLGSGRDKVQGSTWQVAVAEVAVGAGSSTTFEVGPDLSFDEYAVEVKSTTTDQHGTVRSYGRAAKVASLPAAADLQVASRVINAEATNVINVDFALNVPASAQLYAQGYAIPTAAGDLVAAGSAALTIATGTNGTDIQPAGDDDNLLFSTTATGLFELDFTDVAGASSLEFIIHIYEGGPTGRLIEVFAVSFDGV